MPKNFYRIPTRIIERLKTFDQDDVVAGTAKFINTENIDRYKTLGVAIQNGSLVVPPPFVPDVSAGKYSRANVEGLEKVRKDLPMVPKSFWFESPNWGDWSKGSHIVENVRDVYQRDFYPPKQVELSVKLISERDGGFYVRFAIDQVLNRRTPNFEFELLYNLNILQENVGAADVFPSAATLAEYAATVHVDWQILPPGTVDEVIRGMFHGKPRPTPEQESVMRQRIAVMAKLKPESYITGTDKFLRYFGAKFGDDLVIFENVRYGNAIYVMTESWPELSKRSRVELLGAGLSGVRRIVHREGWEAELTGLVHAYQREKRKRR